jgi:hypothetical protein
MERHPPLITSKNFGLPEEDLEQLLSELETLSEEEAEQF